MNNLNFEFVKCAVCKISFKKSKIGRTNRRLTRGVRPMNTITCSPKCSKIYGSLRGKQYRKGAYNNRMEKIKQIKKEIIKRELSRVESCCVCSREITSSNCIGTYKEDFYCDSPRCLSIFLNLMGPTNNLPLGVLQ